MTEKNKDKWIPTTYSEQIVSDVALMINALNNNNLILLEKFNSALTKKIKTKENEHLLLF